MFAAFERLLNENIYLGEEVLRAMAARELGLRRKIRKSLRRDGLCKTINLLANGEVQRNIRWEELHTVVRLPIWVEPRFSDLIVKFPYPRTLQKNLDSKVPKKLRRKAAVVVWPSADGSSWVVQFHTLAGNPAAQAEVYRQAFKYVVELRQQAGQRAERLDEKKLHELLFERLASELIMRALQLVNRSNQDLRWEWKPIAGEPVAIITTRDNAKKFVQRIIKRIKSNKGLSDDAKEAELQGMLTVLEQRHVEGGVVLSIGRLEAYQDREKFCELDGCLVEINNEGIELNYEGKVVVTLVEAKSRNAGAVSKAQDQLGETLKKLGCCCDVEVKKVKGKGTTVAWASVELGGHAICSLAEEESQP
ncbi:MAG: hypothetical protein C4319_09090 [Acidimicrobiia bacterium]